MTTTSYKIIFNRLATEHLEEFQKYERNIILDSIKKHLKYQPTDETRNRKLLRDNPLADWELRVDRFRVFYEVDDMKHIVRIVAIGHKKRERLFIGQKEFKL